MCSSVIKRKLLPEKLSMSSQWIPFLYFFVIVAASFISVWGGHSVGILSLTMLAIMTAYVLLLQKIFRISNLLTFYLSSVLIIFIYLYLLILFFGADFDAIFLASTDATEYYYKACNLSSSEIIKSTFGLNFAYALFLHGLVVWFHLDSATALIVLIIPQLFITPLLALYAYIWAQKVTLDFSPMLVFWLVALDPSILRFATIIQKDVFVAIAVSFGLISFIALRKSGTLFLEIAVFLSMIVISFLLRFRAMPILIAYAAFNILWNSGISKRTKIHLLVGATLLAVLVIFRYMDLFPSDANVLGAFDVVSTESRWSDRLNEIGAGSSGQLSQSINAIQFLPLRTAARAILTVVIPLPPVQFVTMYIFDNLNEWGNQFTLDLGAVYWHLLVPFQFLGIWYLAKKQEFYFITYYLVVVAIMSLTGWLDVRWRLMGIIPAYMLVAYGITAYVKKSYFPYLYYLSLALGWTLYLRRFIN